VRSKITSDGRPD